MAGRIILGILLALALLLAVLLTVPVKLRFSYEDGAPQLWVRYGPVRRRIFPAPEKEEKSSSKIKKKKKPSKKKEKTDKPAKKKAGINREQILYALEKLPPILGRALQRTGRSIHVRPLKVYVLVAGRDPADTALLYGQLEAALHGALPLLERAVWIEDQDIRLFLDFSVREADVIADVGVSLRPGSLVWIALRAGGSLLKWFLGFRKLAYPLPKETDGKPVKPDQTAKEANAEHEAA